MWASYSPVETMRRRPDWSPKWGEPTGISRATRVRPPFRLAVVLTLTAQLYLGAEFHLNAYLTTKPRSSGSREPCGNFRLSGWVSGRSAAPAPGLIAFLRARGA